MTKKYTSGGYVDARTNTYVISPQGSYSVQASVDNGNVNILAMGGANFSRTDYTGFTVTETYKLKPEFTKHSHYDYRKSKTFSSCDGKHQLTQPVADNITIPLHTHQR